MQLLFFFIYHVFNRERSIHPHNLLVKYFPVSSGRNKLNLVYKLLQGEKKVFEKKKDYLENYLEINGAKKLLGESQSFGGQLS